MRYLIVRALLFIAPFTLLMVAQVPWWLSLIVSIAFAFAASIVFFQKLRNEAAADLQRMRDGRKRDGAGPDDADIEDSLFEEPRADSPVSPTDLTDSEASTDPAHLTEPHASADPTHPADPDASARP